MRVSRIGPTHSFPTADIRASFSHLCNLGLLFFVFHIFVLRFAANDYESLLALDANNVSRGLSASQIRQFPTHEVKGEPLPEPCVICLESMEVGQQVRRLACLHAFHNEVRVFVCVCVCVFVCMSGNLDTCDPFYSRATIRVDSRLNDLPC